MQDVNSSDRLTSLSIQRLKVKGFIVGYLNILAMNFIIFAAASVVDSIDFNVLLMIFFITPLLPPIYSLLKPKPNEHSVAYLDDGSLYLLGYEFKKDSVEWMTYYAADDKKHTLGVKLVGYELLEVQLTRPDFIKEMRLFKYITKNFVPVKIVDVM